MNLSTHYLKYFVLLLFVSTLAACKSSYQYWQPNHLAKAADNMDMRYHEVQDDETLYLIAWTYDLDYLDVAAWNRITEPYEVYSGQQLRIAPPSDFESDFDNAALAQEPVSSDEQATVEPTPASAAEEVSEPAAEQTPEPAAEEVSEPTAELSEYSVAKALAAAAFESEDWYEPRMSSLNGWHWPTEGRLLCQFRQTECKKGLHIVGVVGQPIYAAADGEVVYSGDNVKHYKNLILIKHSDNYFSAYAHSREVFVKTGDYVSALQEIASMGIDNSQLPALFFQIRKDGKPIDPLQFFPEVKV